MKSLEFGFSDTDLYYDDWIDLFEKWKLKISEEDIKKSNICSFHNKDYTIVITGMSTADSLEEMDSDRLDMPGNKIVLTISEKVPTKDWIAFLEDFFSAVEYCGNMTVATNINETGFVHHPQWLVKKMLGNKDELSL